MDWVFGAAIGGIGFTLVASALVIHSFVKKAVGFGGWVFDLIKVGLLGVGIFLLLVLVIGV